MRQRLNPKNVDRYSRFSDTPSVRQSGCFAIFGDIANRRDTSPAYLPTLEPLKNIWAPYSGLCSSPDLSTDAIDLAPLYPVQENRPDFSTSTPRGNQFPLTARWCAVAGISFRSRAIGLDRVGLIAVGECFGQTAHRVRPPAKCPGERMDSKFSASHFSQ
jgi:hypothetical protein